MADMAPDISALTQQGASATAPMSAPSQSAPPPEAMTPGMAPPDVTDRSINPTKPPAPPPGAQAPDPHARLLNMIQGLAVGLSAAATSIGTHGKEGGAPEVLQIEQQQAAAARAQQQFATEQKNAQLQQQLLTAQTNTVNGQNMLLFSTMHDTQNERHFQAQEAGLGVQEKAQQMFDTTGQVAPGYDVNPQTGQVMEKGKAAPAAAPTPGNASTPNVLPGVTPGAPAQPTGDAALNIPGQPSIFDRRQNMILNAAGQKLGADDADVTAAKAVLADPKATASQKKQAVLAIQTKAGLAEDVVKDLTAKADLAAKNDAHIASLRPKDLNDAVGRTSAAEQAYKANPTPATSLAVDNAKTAQKLFEDEARRTKQMEQDLQNGDPDIIGSTMANGLYAPSQVLSARSMSKPFYSKVIAAADKAAQASGAPEILDASGKGTGHYFNATKAESQYEYSKNIQTQNVMNKIRTLNEPGGDFDILRDAITELPKLDSNTINKVFNVAGKEFGSSAATNYHMALYNLATLLANVQTGSIPTEGEIQTQLDLMKDSFSKGQLDGALRIDRRDLGARAVSMIGDNPYLKSAYPDLAKGVGQHQVGDHVTLKNGQDVVIKTLDPKTGNFTY